MCHSPPKRSSVAFAEPFVSPHRIGQLMYKGSSPKAPGSQMTEGGGVMRPKKVPADCHTGGPKF
jgi:hypothetical protein